MNPFMQTECPHCHTVFRLDNTALQALSQVRCGHCLAVFTPIILHPAATVEEPGGVIQVSAHESNAENPEPTQHATQTDDEDISLIKEKFAEKTHIVLPDVIPPELRVASREPLRQRSPVATLLWSLVMLALVLSLAAQFAWYNRAQWLQHPAARPWYELACQQLGCELPEPRDASRIELSRKNIFTHPNVAQALMVSGTLVNQAEFEQDYPLMELRFENVRGEVIAARRFTPQEYLNIPQDQIRKMEPGNPMAFTLEIIDPGTDVMSYEFTFL